MADIERILIVGGGIAGLTAATALRRQGFAPELIERSSAWPAIGAGINLPANGVRVLRALGLGEAIDRAAEEVRGWGFFDQQGELLCKTDLRDLWREVGPCLGITRVKLQKALLAGAAAVPHRLGVSLTALTQDESSVEVHLSDGTSGSYDLVVGADGIRSTVRGLALASSPPAYNGQMIWRSVIPTRPQGMVDMMLLMGEKYFLGWFRWVRATPTGLEPLTGNASRTLSTDASTAFDVGLPNSARRFPRISLACNLITTFTLGRLNGSSSTNGIGVEWY
jgi:2-polyprenyl-6-methoxyphenol hydroxylase-like FAD-dependent oxidoreductase